MTILAPITSTEQDHEVCVFENPPLIPFYKRDQMEKAKYLQWLIANVDEDVNVRECQREHPQTGQIETMYPLNHLVRIGAQYESLDAARTAINRTINSANAPVRTRSDGSSDQVQLFGTPLDSITVSDNKGQRWITIADFFKYVFPRLRPSQQGYLPCIYRTHLNANGELVADGSSIVAELTERNYVNMANATGEAQRILEANLISNENAAAPLLPQEMQGNRTVPPSQVGGLPAGGPIRNGDPYYPWLPPTTWEDQMILFRMQADKDAEVEYQRTQDELDKELQRRLAEKKFESQMRMAEMAEKARIKGESDDRNAANTMAIFDHKQQARTNSSTRSRSVVSRAVADPSRFLVGPDWDVKNPATVLQAMAIVIDYFFESSTLATEAVTLESFHGLLITVLRKNYLQFESFEGKVPVNDEGHYWRKNDNIKFAQELIFLAKSQFPKSVVKFVKGAWDLYRGDIVQANIPSMRYVKVRLDRIRELDA